MKTIVRKNRPIWNEFPLMFDDLMNDWSTGSTNSFSPAVNVKESDDAYEVELSVPGFKKDDINVTVEDHKLTVSSELENESETKEGNYTRREFMKRSFSRTFNLPKGMVNNDKVNAKYEDGILHISLPKLDEVKPKPAKRLKIG